MWNILAEVNWEDIVLVGTAMGILGGGKSLISTIKRKNGNGKFIQALCDERHKNIDQRQAEIRTDLTELRKETKEGFTAVFGKLDQIQEHLIR